MKILRAIGSVVAMVALAFAGIFGIGLARQSGAYLGWPIENQAPYVRPFFAVILVACVVLAFAQAKRARASVPRALFTTSITLITCLAVVALIFLITVAITER